MNRGFPLRLFLPEPPAFELKDCHYLDRRRMLKSRRSTVPSEVLLGTMLLIDTNEEDDDSAENFKLGRVLVMPIFMASFFDNPSPACGDIAASNSPEESSHGKIPGGLPSPSRTHETFVLGWRAPASPMDASGNGPRSTCYRQQSVLVF